MQVVETFTLRNLSDYEAAKSRLEEDLKIVRHFRRAGIPSKRSYKDVEQSLVVAIECINLVMGGTKK